MTLLGTRPGTGRLLSKEVSIAPGVLALTLFRVGAAPCENFLLRQGPRLLLSSVFLGFLVTTSGWFPAHGQSV